MSAITLRPGGLCDKETLLALQKAAFAPLYARYRDERSPYLADGPIWKSG